MTLISCRYCEAEHGDLLLCAPAKRVLDALYARGQRFDMPTIEFPEPIAGADMLGEDTVLVQQLVVMGATVPVADVPRPALIFTGRAMGNRVLPKWVYPGSPEEIRKASQLVADMADMSIKAAKDRR